MAKRKTTAETTTPSTIGEAVKTAMDAEATVLPNNETNRTKVDVKLNDVNRREAFNAIEGFYKFYNARNGVADLEAKLATARESLAGHIFGLAHLAQRLGGNYPGPIEAYFNALCVAAEVHVRAKLRIEDPAADPAMTSWAVYKSQILGCVRGGKDGKTAVRPLDYQTLSGMVAAWKTRRDSLAEAERGARNQGGTSDSGEGAQTGAAVATAAKEMNVATALQAKHPGISVALVATIKVMDGIIGKLDHKGQDLLAQKLSKLLTPFGEMVADKPAPKGKKVAEAIPEAAEDAAAAAEAPAAQAAVA